jgi:DNA polymerase III delta prime subunit
METSKLIGPAGKLAAVLLRTLPEKDRVKLLFSGLPGVGKTELANQIALQLCGSHWGIESVNGRNLSIHLVRQWSCDGLSSCLFGTGYKIKIVNEIDTAPADAQDALLSYLDEMPAGRGFIATSNLEIDKLSRRFVTRLQRHDIAAPEPEEIAALLAGQGVPALIAQQIAFLCGGCVRAALLDADAWRDEFRPAASKPARTRTASLQLDEVTV